ncbi:SdiA-regulated domain-containing protein [Motiliproteus sp. MSK22-1]|uniref:SdiA-regulated domain-containing protein n=1 Tax=Motiliproteus sp. MSK22-1 TaxID=1897630 RepID=UPI000977A535|nr:SdiA-regulated domain-containing protein [Motiliproteus sp. MSK22-1]OMH30260.1 hypothetical protein BGP75_17870 [Motiliproteus sp. MSK22-1]
MNTHLFRFFLLLSSWLAIYQDAMASTQTWRDDFNTLEAWTGENHTTNNGILTLNSQLGPIVGKSSHLSEGQGHVSFRVKPADGTPGYANLKIHLFTDAEGQLNSDSYTLALTGAQNKYFKVSRAGYETLYYSGSNGGLLSGPGNWHQIEMEIIDSQLRVIRDDVEVLTLELPSQSIDPSKQYLSIDPKGAQWDLDWLEASQTGNNTGETDGDNSAPTTTWREEFSDLALWNGGPQSLSNGVLTLSSNSNRIVTKLENAQRPNSTVRFKVKPSDGTPEYANLYIHVFTDAQGNTVEDSYTLTLTGTESKFFKLSQSGYKNLYYSGKGQGLLSGPGNWHELSLVFGQQTLSVLRDGEEVYSMAVPELDTAASNGYLSLYARSGNWDFDWLEIETTSGNGNPGDIDSDNDGVSDDLDAFPDNPDYQYDTDQDGLPDSYETLYGLDPSHPDSDLDSDNDGVSNLEEFTNGTDPTSADLALLPPTDLNASVLSASSIKLSWQASNSESIAGYHIYRDGSWLATVQELEFTDNSLLPDSSYQYQLASFDQSDNLSTLTEPVSATTNPESVSIANILPNNPEAPQIRSIPDQGNFTVLQGTTYSYTPEIISNGSEVQWRKAYGPDDLTVDPHTGKVTWQIPEELPGESFHIGVLAANDKGFNIETWVLTVGSGQTLYMGANEELKDLTSALAVMNSGDTLIVRNGVYKGDANRMGDFGNRKRVGPPAGTPANFTTVIAEDPGKVIFDSEGTAKHRPFHLVGKSTHPDWGHVSSADSYEQRSYIALKGMVAKNSDGAGIRLDNVDHVKLVDMGVVDAGRSTGAMSANVYISRSQYVLAEGLYLWGRGRYKLQFYRASESIARRIVARIDEYHGNEPLGGLVAYCSKNMRFQNNIVVDGNARRFWTDTKNLANIYGIPATNCGNYPENIVFERSIGLNTDLGLMATWADSQDNNKPAIWRDVIGWDLEPAKYRHGVGNHIPVLSAPGPSISNNITLGEINFYDSSYFLYSRNRSSYINNSILHNLGYRNGSLMYQGDLLRNTRAGQELGLDHNNIFGFLGQTSANGAGDVYSNNESSIDPEFETFLKLPDNSPLLHMGQNGTRLGAEVLNFIGKSGTFYGDSAFESDADVYMWPFPQETLIQRHFRNYRFNGATVNDDGSTGPEQTLYGARGFAGCDETEQELTQRQASYGCQTEKTGLNNKDPLTLSSYIWEYLGTECSAENCGYYQATPDSDVQGPYPLDQYHKITEVSLLTSNGDLSGITYNSELDQFITIHNGDKYMNLFDGDMNFISQMNNGYNGNDHEDLLFIGEKNGQHEYAVVDEYGRLFLGTIDPGASLRYGDFQRITYADLPLKKNNGGEGVAYDAANDTFYVCVEGQVAPSPMVIYQFQRPATDQDISYQDSQLTVTSPFDAETLRPLINDISSCYFNTTNNSLLLMSDVSEKIIEVSLSGQVLNTLSIDEDFLNNAQGSQFEGMTFSRDYSKLILVSEDNHYVIYQYQAP